MVCYARCNDIGGLLSHKARPGTTGYDQVRPGTTGMKCPAMSGWLWIGSTQPLGKCEGTRMDKDLTGTGQGRE